MYFPGKVGKQLLPLNGVEEGKVYYIFFRVLSKEVAS
jgi:hypothetical protein